MISRRSFLKRASAATAAATLLPILPGMASPRNGTFTELRRGVGTYTNRGGTIGWMIRNDAVVVIDSQYPGTAKACWDGMTERGAEGLSMLINTHHHGDHTAGNPAFDAHTDRIVAHANVPKLQRQSAEQQDDPGEQAYANETYDEDMVLDAGDETISLRHYGPAHTAGDSVIFFENANVVHMGDLVFNRAYPYIDVYGGGADTDNWASMLDTVYQDFDDETQFIFGHGNPEFGVTGTREDLLPMRDFLVELRGYVAMQMQDGASLEEMKQIEVLDGFEDWQFDWAISLDRCIDAVHQEMSESEGE